MNISRAMFAVAFLACQPHQIPIKDPSTTPPDVLGVLRVERTLKLEKQLICSVLFAPDGRTFAACGMENIGVFAGSSQVKTWSTDSGAETARINYTDTFITSMIYASDGGKLVTASIDKTLRLTDLSSKNTNIISKDLGQVLNVAKDRQLISVSSYGQLVHLFDLRNNKLVGTREMDDAFDQVECQTSFSPTEKLIALSRYDIRRKPVYAVELCEIPTLKCIAVLRAEAGHVTSLDFSHDGNLLVTGEENGRIIVWDIRTRKQKSSMFIFKGSEYKSIKQVTFSPDSQLIGIGGVDVAMILKTETLEKVGVIQGTGGFVMAFSPDGTSLVTGCSSTVSPPFINLWSVGKP